jgi:hypothetical protein
LTSFAMNCSMLIFAFLCDDPPAARLPGRLIRPI